MPNLLAKLIPQRDAGFTPLAAALHAFSPFWAIEPNYAAAAVRMLESVDFAAHAEEFRASMIGAQDDDDDNALYDLDDSGVATISLSGVLMKRPSSWGRNTSYLLTRRAVRTAAADSRVKAIALMIDSPGGNNDGCADAAADIFAVRGQKPIGAYIDGCGCSAAYWLASQCDFIWCSRQAMTANCGILCTLVDSSTAAKTDGLKFIQVKSAPLKGIGEPGSPVTAEAIAEFQRLVDVNVAGFRADVGKGRGLDSDALDSLFDARVRVGEDAVASGAVDRVATIDEFYAKLGAPEGADDELADESEDAGDCDPDDDASQSKTAGASAAVNHTAAASGNQEKHNMREKFAAALRSARLTGLAEAVMRAKDDSDEAISASLSAQARADEAYTPHAPAPAPPPAAVPSGTVRAAFERDILTACAAAGITSAGQLAETLDFAALGREHAEEVREDAKQEAVRCHGAALGQQLHAQCDVLPISALKPMRDAWRAEADAKFGIGNKQTDKRAKDAKAPDRASAPQRVAVAAETDAPDAPVSAYAALSVDQKKAVDAMVPASLSGGSLDERRETIAKAYLAKKEDK